MRPRAARVKVAVPGAASPLRDPGPSVPHRCLPPVSRRHLSMPHSWQTGKGLWATATKSRCSEVFQDISRWEQIHALVRRLANSLSTSSPSPVLKWRPSPRPGWCACQFPDRWCRQVLSMAETARRGTRHRKTYAAAREDRKAPRSSRSAPPRSPSSRRRSPRRPRLEPWEHHRRPARPWSSHTKPHRSRGGSGLSPTVPRSSPYRPRRSPELLKNSLNMNVCHLRLGTSVFLTSEPQEIKKSIHIYTHRINAS